MTLTPPLEPPRTFSHAPGSRSITFVVDWAVKKYQGTGIAPKDRVLAHTDEFYSAKPGKQPGFIELEEAETDEARIEALRNAKVLCFGGITHEDKAIAAVAASYYALRNAFEHPPEEALTENIKPIFPSEDIAAYPVMIFNPGLGQELRVAQAYDFNRNVYYTSNEADIIAYKIYDAKFKDKNGALLPPDQMNDFTMFTYSMGARVSLMVERKLEELLVRVDGKDSATVQQYFDHIKRVSIGSSVDVHHLDPYSPRIKTMHVVGQSDRGMAYWDEFCKRFIDSSSAATPEGYGTFAEGQKHKLIDLGSVFKKGKDHELLLLTADAVPTRRGAVINSHNHGLSEYIIALRDTVALNPEHRQKMLAMLNAEPARGTEQAADAQAPERSNIPAPQGGLQLSTVKEITAQGGEVIKPTPPTDAVKEDPAAEASSALNIPPRRAAAHQRGAAG